MSQALKIIFKHWLTERYADVHDISREQIIKVPMVPAEMEESDLMYFNM